MRSNYKKLGQYIAPVNIRNKDLSVETLLGVSIQKCFIPSIANTIGSDMSKYKIIKKFQFAYGPVTSRNGDKISVAFLDDLESALISQAYTAFEVIDHNQLDPEYLMMWFRRPEFDRYARFKSHGSTRETFDWEEMCDIELPIPSIEKQRAIVKEYNTVVNRIKLNEELNQKLEETAQAIYKEWFVDFEFPITEESCPELASESPHLIGKPYKSSGGKMVWNEELDKEVPEGWEVVNCDSIASISAGGDKPKEYSPFETENHQIPIYSNSTFDDGLFGYTNVAKILNKSVTISARGGIGFTSLRTKPYVPIVRLIVVLPNEIHFLNYLYHCLSNIEYNDIASAQAQLTIPDVSIFKILKPKENILNSFQCLSKVVYDSIELKKKTNKKIDGFRNMILSKMSKIELEKEIKSE